MHLAGVHNIGVVWHECDICEWRAKQSGQLKKHKSVKHGVGEVKWYRCEECEFKTHWKQSVLRHKHDVNSGGFSGGRGIWRGGSDTASHEVKMGGGNILYALLTEKCFNFF